jgi:predicted nucleic acid-binding protein
MRMMRHHDAEQKARLEALRRSAGSWKGRRFSGSEYVDALRGDLDERLRRLGLLLEGLISEGETLVASEVTRFELLAGVRETELDALEAFFSALVWAPVDEVVSRAAGALARRHRRGHGRIDDADYLIAATAIVLAAELLTTNIRHFPMIEGLRAPY